MTGADYNYVVLPFAFRRALCYSHVVKLTTNSAPAISLMPLTISANLPTVLVRKTSFDSNGLTRLELDTAFNLTDAEFRVEDQLIAIGPLPNEDTLPELISFLEEKGLVYFDDFFELSGNWPEWLALYARSWRN